jgi:hypothetical protein
VEQEEEIKAKVQSPSDMFHEIKIKEQIEYQLVVMQRKQIRQANLSPLVSRLVKPTKEQEPLP